MALRPAGRRTWRPFIWDDRYRPPPATNPDDEPERAPRHAGARRLSSLFGFAPGGVCHAVRVTASAVRSYRTLSPLPSHAMAVCSLWHFPWGRPRRTLSGTVFPWSPDFPPPRCGSGRPAGWPGCDVGPGTPSRQGKSAAVRPASASRSGVHIGIAPWQAPKTEHVRELKPSYRVSSRANSRYK